VLVVGQALPGAHLLRARLCLMVEYVLEGVDDFRAFLRKHFLKLCELASAVR
jgi:hypothetical protein